MRYSLDLRRVAARQHGLVTLEQAVADGWSRATWYRAVRRRCGSACVAPAVAALPGAPDTPEQRILAAILARGGRAIASHRSAAYLWGVDIDGANPVDITGADRGCRPALDWVAAHNPRDVDDLRPVQRHGIPTTNPLRVLVDLGQVAPSAVTAALEHFLAEGLVDLRSVRAALVRHARQGPARDLRPPRCARRRDHRRRAGRQRAGAGHGQVARRPRPAAGAVPRPHPRLRGGLRHRAGAGGPRVRRVDQPRPRSRAVRARPAAGRGARRRRDGSSCASRGRRSPVGRRGSRRPSGGPWRSAHRPPEADLARDRRTVATEPRQNPGGDGRPPADAGATRRGDRRERQRPSQSSYSAWKWRTLVSW